MNTGSVLVYESLLDYHLNTNIDLGSYAGIKAHKGASATFKLYERLFKII